MHVCCPPPPLPFLPPLRTRRVIFSWRLHLPTTAADADAPHCSPPPLSWIRCLTAITLGRRPYIAPHHTHTTCCLHCLASSIEMKHAPSTTHGRRRGREPCCPLFHIVPDDPSSLPLLLLHPTLANPTPSAACQSSARVPSPVAPPCMHHPLVPLLSLRIVPSVTCPFVPPPTQYNFRVRHR